MTAPAPALETVTCAVCGSDERQPARIRAPKDDHAVELAMPGGRSAWVVCESCGLVYQSPRPGPAAVEQLYTGGTYHTTRGGVPEHYVQYSLRRSNAALAWAFSQPALSGLTGRAVDVGCGIGGALVNLRERGFEVVGVEPDVELVEVGTSRFGLDIRTGLLGDDTFPPGESFDFAYSCHVWEHLADPVATSRVVQRLLRERRGWFLVVVPTFRQARTLAWSCFTVPHTYMFTDVSLGNVLDRVGFDVVAHRYAAGADSELWLLARARPATGDDVAAADRFRREPAAGIQRELALVPLRAPLGLPRRAVDHARTLLADPKDFKDRLVRAVRYRVQRLRTTLSRS